MSGRFGHTETRVNSNYLGLFYQSLPTDKKFASSSSPEILDYFITQSHGIQTIVKILELKKLSVVHKN